MAAPGDPPAADAAAQGLPQRAPDFIEQDSPDTIDNVIPTRGYEMTPMVALGGSAGSIAALQEFFRAMPTDSGMVFVVIVHLAPGFESTLPELLGRSTPMPVLKAQDRVRVQPNAIYVIPPGKELVTVDGHLRLTDLQVERGRRVVVDLFFRSLADTHGPHAAAIVLSGADGDGALGIKRIKERGGLTIAQDPDESEHPGMPRAAIDTGMVDWILQVRDIPTRLLAYVEQERKLRLPPEEGPQPAAAAPVTDDGAEGALRDVLGYLRTRTGRDFSYYKRATILRRIAPPHAGQRRQRHGRLSVVPAHPPGRVGGAAQGSADLGHQLLPRPRRVRGDRNPDSLPVRQQAPD